MSRASALVRLGGAYARHELRRRLRRGPGSGAGRLLQLYGPDHLVPLTEAERDLLPAASACINCGLCALVAARVAGLRPADLAAAYLRDYPILPAAASDLVGEAPAAVMASAAAACPVGVPLEGVLAMIRRLTSA